MNFQSVYPFIITRIFTAFDFKWDNSFSNDGEYHNFWEAVAVMEGEIEVVEDERVYNLISGDIVFHKPMEFHRIKSVNNGCARVLILTFMNTGKLPDKLSDGVFSLSGSELKQYCEIFNNISDSLNVSQDNFYNRAEALFSLSAFLIKLTEIHKPFERISSFYRATEYRKIVTVMNEHISDNLTLSQIAGLSAVSVSTVKKLFSDFAGISPKKYYSQLRANEALNMLKEGLSVADVSLNLNFSSPNYFTHFFYGQFGFLPSKYRQKSHF